MLQHADNEILLFFNKMHTDRRRWACDTLYLSVTFRSAIVAEVGVEEIESAILEMAEGMLKCLFKFFVVRKR